jgi:hypothetical protein
MWRGMPPAVLLLLSRPVLAFSNDLLVLDTATNRAIASIDSARPADGQQLAERPVAKTYKVSLWHIAESLAAAGQVRFRGYCRC